MFDSIPYAVACLILFSLLYLLTSLFLRLCIGNVYRVSFNLASGEVNTIKVTARNKEQAIKKASVRLALHDR